MRGERIERRHRVIKANRNQGCANEKDDGVTQVWEATFRFQAILSAGIAGDWENVMLWQRAAFMSVLR